MKGKIITAVFILLLAASAAMIAAGSGTTAAENRAAASFPPFDRQTVLSGGFASGVESYINDRVACREYIIELSRRLGARMGITPPEGVVIRADVDMGTGESLASDILVANGAVTEIFDFSAECADRWADAVNAYTKYLDGVNVYAALVPTRLEFAEPIYSNLEDSQSEAIRYIYSRLAPGVTPVDMRAALAPHTGEYVYFRTDHHWTALGAYYGYRALCGAADVGAVDIGGFEKNVKTPFKGYLSAFVADKSLLDKPDALEWYDTDAAGEITNVMYSRGEGGAWHEYHTPIYYDERSDYDFFLGADHPFALYKNPGALTDKTVLIVSDSFVNALAPWLMKTYKAVALINPRSFGGTLGEAVQKLRPDDFLVLDYTFAASFPDYCAAMESLLPHSADISAAP